MKIGILTHHHISNEGAVLQAYAQAKMLQNHFPQARVEVVDLWIKSYSALTKKKWNKPRNIMFRNFIENNLPLSERFISDSYEDSLNFVNSLDYDIVVVGSDEVWKLEWGKYTKTFPNIYWLSPKLNCRKIAMSASANLLIYKNRGKEQLERMRELLSSFEFLGVRDDHTREFLEVIGLKGFKMCDPAIAYDFPEIDLSKKLKKIGIDINKPILGVRIPKGKQRLIAADCQYFKDRGYQIVSFMHSNEFADFNIQAVLNPIEWANLFRYMNFCVSNSYHSLIFSIKNKVPIKVVDFDPAYKEIESKTRNLLNDLDMLYCYGKIGEILQKYSVDKNRLNSLKQTYLNALDKIGGNYDNGDS
ncbi:MAG: polysaccharide pyruvyl transferase family protein [Phycisphaerae bacterium]|jgi:polysaccharide pyruvyl transferase WcaK-like protein